MSVAPIAQILTQQEAASISLNDLEEIAIEKWGNKVETHERSYGPYDRRTIDTKVQAAINLRWTASSFQRYLPPTLTEKKRSEGSAYVNSEWLDPTIISTHDLKNFLLKTCGTDSRGTGLELGHREILKFIESQTLPLREKTHLRGTEDFLIKMESLLSQASLPSDPKQEKALCRALIYMVKRSCRTDNAIDATIGIAYLAEIEYDDCRSFPVALAKISAGYNSTIALVTGNSLWSRGLAAMTRTPRDRRSPSPDSDKDEPRGRGRKREKDRKDRSRDRSRSKSKDRTDSDRRAPKDSENPTKKSRRDTREVSFSRNSTPHSPQCAGCGRWLKGDHSDAKSVAMLPTKPLVITTNGKR